MTYKDLGEYFKAYMKAEKGYKNEAEKFSPSRVKDALPLFFNHHEHC